MLDSDLARLYEVETRILNQAMSRNGGRFPKDFAFRLTREEWTNLKSQFVISSLESGYGGRRSVPTVFTEHGVTMIAALLRSERAVEVSVRIVREFVRMRRWRTRRGCRSGRRVRRGGPSGGGWRRR